MRQRLKYHSRFHVGPEGVERTKGYVIVAEGRRRWRLYLDGRRTAYCGDTYAEADGMRRHLELKK
jgi:hypothetical protein